MKTKEQIEGKIKGYEEELSVLVESEENSIVRRYLKTNITSLRWVLE